MRFATLALLAGLALNAQVTVAPTDDHAEVALQAAIRTEMVDGDLQSAIRQYEAITRSGNRAAAAQALVKMGRCYEKLGRPEAVAAYERVVHEYSDQKDALAEAQGRLLGLENKKAAAGMPSAATGGIGWYNGDWCHCARGLRNQMIDDRQYAMVYDDFVVPSGGWTVVGVFSNNFMNQPAVTQAYWEIRKGMSEANGGKVVASKTSAATLHPRTQLTSDGAAEYEVRVDGLNVQLEPGRYWLAVAPLVQGLSYVNATRGQNAIGTPPGNDGDCYFDVDLHGMYKHFVKSGDASPGVHDSSLGVRIAAIAAH